MSVFKILAEKGRDVVTAKADASMHDVAKVLGEKKIGAVVVLQDDGKVCGIVSERDIVREIGRDGAQALDRPVSTCMTKDVVSCRELETVDEVMMKMTRGRFRHLPVIENGEIHGIISIGDVVKRKIQEVERDAEELKRYIAS